MSTTPTTKSPLQSKNLWTGVATLVASIFLFFGVTVDSAAVELITDTSGQVADAIQTKNWTAILIILVNSGNMLFHLFKTWFGKN